MTGRELRRLRLRLDLTQEQLAEKIGLRANTVSRYETDGLAIPKAVELAVRYLILKMEQSEPDAAR